MVAEEFVFGLELPSIGDNRMCQAMIRRLSYRTASCQVRKVASLLTEPLTLELASSISVLDRPDSHRWQLDSMCGDIPSLSKAIVGLLPLAVYDMDLTLLYCRHYSRWRGLSFCRGRENGRRSPARAIYCEGAEQAVKRYLRNGVKDRTRCLPTRTR